MRLLLDTLPSYGWSRALPGLWNPPESIVDPANDVYLSAASAWEIAVKHGIGRLPLRMPPEEYVVEQRRLHRIESLPITEEAALQAGKLPNLHRDPFDRVIVAQANVDGLSVVTPDRLIRMYPVRVSW